MEGNYQGRGFAALVADIEPFRVVEVLARATELGREELDGQQQRFYCTTSMERLEIAVERLAGALS